MRPYILAETNWKIVKDTLYEIAILPWGATEPHNFHLPYSTDQIEAETIAAESARLAWGKQVKVIVLPTIPFGVNTGQFDIRLDINLNPTTQHFILQDIIETLNRQVIRKLVILNSHGGNNFRQTLRELGLKFPDMFLCELDWYKMREQEQIFDNPGEHAGEVETSLLLFLKPEWVRPLDEAGDGAAKKFRFDAMNEGWGWAERRWSMVTNDTGIGNPAKATSEKGKRFFELVTQKIAAFLVDLSKTSSDEMFV